MNKEKIEQAVYHIKGITEYIENVLENFPYCNHNEEHYIKELQLRIKDISFRYGFYYFSFIIFYYKQ